MKMPCDIVLQCEDAADLYPTLNTSAEAPDRFRYWGINWRWNNPHGPDLPTGTDPDYTCDDVWDLLTSMQSQDMADLIAAALAVDPTFCNLCPCNLTETEDMGEYGNDEQTCTLTCWTGATFSFTVPANTMLSGPIDNSLGDAWVAMANAWALSYACDKAAELSTCLSWTEDDDDGSVGDDGGEAQNYDGHPKERWICKNQEIDKAKNTYFVSGGLDTREWTWSISAGNLPPGIQLKVTPGSTQSAYLEGTFTAPGDYTYTIRAESTTLPLLSMEITQTIHVLGLTNPEAITDIDDCSGTWSSYSYQFSASGGTAPYTFSASALPAFFTLSSGGLLTQNRALLPGEIEKTHHFSVCVTDAKAHVCCQSATLYAHQCITIALNGSGYLTSSGGSCTGGTQQIELVGIRTSAVAGLGTGAYSFISMSGLNVWLNAVYTFKVTVVTKGTYCKWTQSQMQCSGTLLPYHYYVNGVLYTLVLTESHPSGKNAGESDTWTVQIKI
jgi:hypothetical protein